jgi:hypothetical protein
VWYKGKNLDLYGDAAVSDKQKKQNTLDKMHNDNY